MIQFVKKNKNRHSFDLNKLKKSLVRSGANTDLALKICLEVNNIFNVDEVSSTQIHNYVSKALRKQDPETAINYNLKRGLASLGPSGYPFEVLCAEIFKQWGYQTKVGVTIAGQFVTHEVDVLAVKGGEVIMCECKYHNSLGVKNDIKIPLYIHSRALDINANPHSQNHDHFVIFSNTRFSLDAQKYSKGVGLRLISLDDNDENVIDYLKKYRVYPVTCLLNLTREQKRVLLDNKIIVISQLESSLGRLPELGFNDIQINKIKNEINILRS